MALWTDIIDPATLTGYARQSLADYEAQKGSLAQWLPNREVGDTIVRFVAGQSGLVEEARYRAYDAEPELGKSAPQKRVTLELPAISRNEPVSEYQQLRMRNAPADTFENAILAATRRSVQSIADRVERTRGVVLATGKATVDQDNFKSDDDFGRDADMTTTAPNLWADPSVDRLGYLETLFDLYVEKNGVEPGSLLMSNRVFRALAQGDQFKTVLVGGGDRPATEQQVRDVASGAGLPAIYRFDRRTASGRVLPDDRILLLPAPVDGNGESELGATFWGQTLTSTDPAYGIADSEQPGVVVGTYRNEKPPMIAEVIGDSISLPVLANANLSLSAKVL